MHFNGLRLQGFKSFVDPVTLHIHSGLTGIVGPNGCGKSNLVEALRWVMGENSAKRMRGSEMDDVIFAGTTTRPSRNIAEVTLMLDNSTRTAPAEYNGEEQLAVMRKIERGSGSDYRINGRPARQRDVQMMFADQSTGAHSTSVVGQGQIDALIRAKPQDRRQILEEASGTAGLQARRHEAELKLKGAEQNLTRVDDVLNALETQLRSLKQQVRQASRYRNLAEHIRRTEAALLHLRWVEANENAGKTREALIFAEARVSELLSIVTQGHTARATMAAELPALRQAEAVAAAALQKLTLAREQNEAETRRINNDIKAQEQFLAQATGDQQREQARHHDGATAVEKLTDEQAQLETKHTEFDAVLPSVCSALALASAEVETLDSTLATLLEQVARAEAQQNALRQEIETLTHRQTKLTVRRSELDAQRVQLLADIAGGADLSLSSAMADACESELAKRQQQAEEAEHARRDVEATQNAKRDRAQETQSVLTKLEAEAHALTTMLANTDSQTERVIDFITVTPGFENALAVALGEALTASLNNESAMYWRALPPLVDAPALPSNVLPLERYIKAPDALARGLSQIGVVDDREAGEVASAALQVGQIIVSRDGWAWRWDGFTVTPQAKTTTAVRLQQRNRLAALQEEIAVAREAADVAKADLSEATQLLQQCQILDQQTRSSLQAAFKALNDARALNAKRESEAAAANTKLTNLDESLQQIMLDLEQMSLRAVDIESERNRLPPIDELRVTITSSRASLSELRSQQAKHQSERDRLIREQSLCRERQKAVVQELSDWQKRMASAATQSAALTERIADVQEKLTQLCAKPEELTAERSQLLSEIVIAEATRSEAADRLIKAEQKLHTVEHQLKQDEALQGNAREDRVRAEAAVQAADEHFHTLRERMTEKLDCAPDDLQTIAAYAEGEAWPSVSELDQALARYLRERENMGPVNLRAEVESETVQSDINKLQQEKDDLVAAIATLRQGISQLNREARERLQSAFTLVNERFQVLFQRLFIGGKAHLELIDNEDPMNAGLEIFAAPPGKKAQVLSLLSGGERTLTALALLFAVFQTNPSPICVLDEAEAALDESNIDRFCSLVEDISRETGTRFLIITHQRLTMARMDRLYGVTMGEKGVSQLVSVDLAGAVAVRDGAMPKNTEDYDAVFDDVQVDEQAA